MDNDLRKLAGLPIPKPPKDKPKEPEPEVGRRKRKNKGKFGQSEEKTDKSFMVPRSIDLQVILTLQSKEAGPFHNWNVFSSFLAGESQNHALRSVPVEVLPGLPVAHRLQFFCNLSLCCY